jgi:Conjugative transposon protein TcpC
MIWRRGTRTQSVSSRNPQRKADGTSRHLLMRPWAVRAATLALWLMVGVGALGGIGSMATRSAATPTSVAKPPSSTADVEGFAQLFVTAYLEAGQGTESSLKPFYPGTVNLSQIEAGQLYVSQTVSLGARAIGPGYWSVTVAADVLGARDGAYQPLGLRFYSVGVIRIGDAFVATSAPSEVPAPITAALPKLRVGTPTFPKSDPITQAIDHFFQAFLAGQGEVDRYTAPDSGIRAVRPAPFPTVSLELVGLLPTDASQTAYLAQVEVRGTDADGRQQVLDFALELDRRAGLWEVSRLLPAPPLSEGSP